MGAEIELGAGEHRGIEGLKQVLFICGKARMRSPTAAVVAETWDGVKADFAGLSNDADECLSLEQLDWADRVFVMEPRQKKKLTAEFGRHLRDTPVTVLGIADKFGYMQTELVDILEIKLRPYLNG